MIRSIAIAVSLVLTLTAASCQTSVIDTSCTAFQPITYSASGDSEATKAQIRGHNAAWLRLCGSR